MGIVNNPVTYNADDGWHGSQTRIKVMPSDFIQNNDFDRGTIEASLDAAKAGGSRLGIVVSNLSMELYACVTIPQGYKATGMKMAGTDGANEVWAWEACVVGCPGIPLFDTSGTYVVNTEYDFDGSANSPSGGADSMTADEHNYLLIWVETEAVNDAIYGGYVNIEKA